MRHTAAQFKVNYYICRKKMFKKLKERLRLRKEDKEQQKFDREHINCTLFGKWENGRRVYSNGCYSIPAGYDKHGGPKMELYSQNGKSLFIAPIRDIVDWHHGFVQVEMIYSQVDMFYDCVGNCIFCQGVFCEDKELGENLWVIPYTEKKFLLYNHKEHFLVDDKDSSEGRNGIIFDGLKTVTGDSGEKVIIGNIDNQCVTDGWGTLSNERYYDEFYQINLDGNILKTWKEWKTESGKK